MRATFWRYIFPTLISFMSSAINGVIDAAIVGHLVGPSGLSVINMCMPINYVMILLLSVTFVGASMVISRDIAKGDYESVHRTFTTAIVTSLTLTAIVGLTLYVNIGAVVSLLCHDVALQPLVEDYICVQLSGFAVTNLCGCLCLAVKADSSPRLVSFAVMFCCLLNLTLDVVFIKYGDMGVVGSAWAYNVGFIVGSIILSSHFLLRRNHLKPGRIYPPRNWREMIRMGLPMTVLQMLTAIKIASVNGIVCDHIGTNGEVMLSLYQNLTIFASLFYCGACQVMQLLNSANLGSGDRRGYRTTLRITALFVLVAEVCVVAGVCLFPQQYAGLFHVTLEDAFMLQEFALAVPLIAANYVIMGVYQITNRSTLAVAVSSCQALLVIPAMIAMMHIAKLHFSLAYALGEVATMAMILVCRQSLFPSSDAHEVYFDAIGRKDAPKLQQLVSESPLPERVKADLQESLRYYKSGEARWRRLEITVYAAADEMNVIIRADGPRITGLNWSLGLNQCVLTCGDSSGKGLT